MMASVHSRVRPVERSARISAPSTAVLLAPFLALVAVFLVVPLYQMAATAFGDTDARTVVASYFTEDLQLTILWKTLAYGALITILTIAIGTVFAWVLRFSESKALKALVVAAVIIPFWMGSVMKNYAIIILIEPQGIINQTLVKWGVIDEPLGMLYTPGAVVAGIVYQLVPFVLLPLYIALRAVDSDTILASQSLGAKRSTAIRTIALPLSLPGVVAAAIITFPIAIGFFLTPILLGGARSQFVASLIYNDIFAFYNSSRAAASGIALLIVATVVIMLGMLTVRRALVKAVLS